MGTQRKCSFIDFHLSWAAAPTATKWEGEHGVLPVRQTAAFQSSTRAPHFRTSAPNFVGSVSAGLLTSPEHARRRHNERAAACQHAPVTALLQQCRTGRASLRASRRRAPRCWEPGPDRRAAPRGPVPSQVPNLPSLPAWLTRIADGELLNENFRPPGRTALFPPEPLTAAHPRFVTSPAAAAGTAAGAQRCPDGTDGSGSRRRHCEDEAQRRASTTARAHSAAAALSGSPQQRGLRAAIVWEPPPPRGERGVIEEPRSAGPGLPTGRGPPARAGAPRCRLERTVGPGAAVPLRRGRWARAAGTARSVPGSGPLPPGSRRCPHCRSRPRAGASSPPRRGADGGREAPRVGPFPPGEPPPRTFCSSAEAGSGLSADMAPRQQHGGRGAAPPRSAAQRSSASAQDGGGSQDGAPAGPHFLRAQPPAARPRAQRLSGATFGVGPTLRYVTLTSGLPPRALIDYRKRCRVLFGAALVRALCGRSAHRGAAPTRGLRPCRYSAVRSAQGKHSAENAAVPWNCALREQT